MAESETRISGDPAYVVLSKEVQDLLASNNVSLNDVLLRANLGSGNAKLDPDPAQQTQGTREPVSVILASAAGIAALTPLVVNIVRSFTNRPIHVEDCELTPALDGKGNVVRGSDGEPIMMWRRTNRILTPPRETGVTAAKVKGFGVEISIEQSQTDKSSG